MFNNADWALSYDRLKATMQKEILLLREILANMHEEEIAIEYQDPNNFERVLEQRAQMVEHLGVIREMRRQEIAVLEKLTPSGNWESAIESDVNESYTFFALRDQMGMLLDRVNLLSAHHHQQSTSQIGRRFEQEPGTLSQKKKKTSLATYPKDE